MRWIPLVALVACGPRLGPPPAPPPSLEPRGLVVTLAWEAPVDLDLYVTDPAWATVYYARRDGHLEADARCLGDRPTAQVERARWTDPPPGRYRVGVDFPAVCSGDADAVSFRLTVDVQGERREVTGTVRIEERQPAAMEFTVP